MHNSKSLSAYAHVRIGFFPKSGSGIQLFGTKEPVIGKDRQASV